MVPLPSSRGGQAGLAPGARQGILSQEEPPFLGRAEAGLLLPCEALCFLAGRVSTSTDFLPQVLLGIALLPTGISEEPHSPGGTWHLHQQSSLLNINWMHFHFS